MSATELKELMKNDFCDNYLEKLYYFCLKKTGDSYEAEELSQDISLNVLESLEKGTVPMHFSAWVWQIARNRYSVWATKKHLRAESVSGADAESLEIADDYSFEHEYVHKEEMLSLRRELAFISSEYRQIIVSYYIEDKKIKDIASVLDIPEGTVKTKLFRARKMLKEGMNMAREFGIRSYRPEDIDFVMSGEINGDIPWSFVERGIPKNILLEASNNPSTVDELAIELGIAVPYMEEEVKILEKATLLKKTADGKYLTNFHIMDKDTQMKLWLCMNEGSERRSRLIHKICEECLENLKKVILVPKSMSDEEILWWAVLYLVDIATASLPKFDCKIEPRSNGERWMIRGYERSDVTTEHFVGNNVFCEGELNARFSTYKIKKYGLWDRVGEMDQTDAGFLAEAIRKSRSVSSLNETELAIWKNIDGRFAHEEEGLIVSDILVWHDDGEGYKNVDAVFKANKGFDELISEMKMLYDKLEDILKSGCTSIDNKEAAKIISTELWKLRGITVIDEVESGRLTVPTKPEKSTIAMYLTI